MIAKKVTTNFDLTKTSDLDCIPVVVLKNCEPELSEILAELFNMSLKESFFFRFLESFIVGPYFLRILGKGPQLQTANLLWYVKSLKIL